jgi:hypothetical protein
MCDGCEAMEVTGSTTSHGDIMQARNLATWPLPTSVRAMEVRGNQLGACRSQELAFSKPSMNVEHLLEEEG